MFDSTSPPLSRQATRGKSLPGQVKLLAVKHFLPDKSDARFLPGNQQSLTISGLARELMPSYSGIVPAGTTEGHIR